ncbi:hypothetical protein HHK36_006322 [Tetracentron sinense]|uniref:RING-type domain-containing protein n=1 Tax=Tetracentron sinense TaxID=13715 RepID=A0A834ZGZ4_TETSI|nr:hypothetical protein HHK36_006322 [Tetracentron sinense]
MILILTNLISDDAAVHVVQEDRGEAHGELEQVQVCGEEALVHAAVLEGVDLRADQVDRHADQVDRRADHVDQREDYPTELLASFAEDCDPVNDQCKSSREESSSIFGSETECSSSITENGASSQSSSNTIENNSIEYGSRSIETSNVGKCLSESKELVPRQLNAIGSYWERTIDTASTSSKEQQPLDSTSVNVGTSMDTVVEVDDSKNEGGSRIYPVGICSSSTPSQELGDSFTSGISSVENHAVEDMRIHNSDSSSVPVVSDSPVTLQSLGDESAQGITPPGLGFLLPNRQGEGGSGSVLHVDVVSIPSNLLSSSTGEISNREVRRNSRRLFWNSFSRRSSRRHIDSPTIVFSTNDTDDLGSHDRWLLDLSGDFFENGVGGDSGYPSSRGQGMYERQSRSEIWERIRGGLDESGRRTTFCAYGLHADGTCSCESVLMAEESGTRASVSPIVMIAEALFEVLDEIHRQPASLSLSMVSRPAPELVVNSFPLKNHKMPNTVESGDDVEQCYICLADYEEGDKIRVLPCRHEYHMSCVDKWLKEIKGVCPLCRGDVCEGVAEGSVSN